MGGGEPSRARTPLRGRTSFEEMYDAACARVDPAALAPYSAPGMAGARYDTIGHGYTRTRREDPRFRERVVAALGDARTVVNVGDGALRALSEYDVGLRLVVGVP